MPFGLIFFFLCNDISDALVFKYFRTILWFSVIAKP